MAQYYVTGDAILLDLFHSQWLFDAILAPQDLGLWEVSKPVPVSLLILSALAPTATITTKAISRSRFRQRSQSSPEGNPLIDIAIEAGIWCP